MNTANGILTGAKARELEEAGWVLVKSDRLSTLERLYHAMDDLEDCKRMQNLYRWRNDVSASDWNFQVQRYKNADSSIALLVREMRELGRRDGG